MAERVPSEDLEQLHFVQWLELKGYKFTSIPNSTFTRSWNQKRRNTMLGLRAGFPDLIVIAEKKFMAIEMKKRKGGQVTAYQKEWIEALTEAGIPAKVCNGAEEAITFVKSVIRSQ